ncbi:non-structural maintenance of chromosomes element 1 homolog [Neocloeon triangulifer]|uniref:non-structural maintenance of chromosomes element 1 homolog n=1 Tax=Neocloeon triangulifer TaxID=2078957 RepID=UPI00286FA1D5|nr:non-structural maintenance of chromosomes element 1 homolog [Neocloeon triangulifer]XP_059474973.1 non-structural maintenance of chromosomes element 1 homolog [Neocloeon triangulifer]XP_059474974.1 non-structural maintenance of chromosomes element 1 homolog [Neocloeon triangulifer]XP_059474975.1 non-structural maintenance of chromosomes element 1 homolog [Neocloeon triangulifer]
MANYGDNHRRFLKSLMAMNNVVAQKKAVELYCTCRDQGSNEESIAPSQDATAEKAISKFIEQINSKIEPLNLSIKLVVCESTNKKFYILHTLSDNELTKTIAGRQWGRNERAVLKTVIKAVCKSPSGKVSVSACARECADLPDKIKRNDVTKILQKLISQNWLCEVGDQIYIGPRALAEIKRYLMDEFEDQAGTCKLCHEMTLRGPSCPSKCGVRVHQSCLELYFSKGASKKCMGCKKEWALAKGSAVQQVEEDSPMEEEASDDEMDC